MVHQILSHPHNISFPPRHQIFPPGFTWMTLMYLFSRNASVTSSMRPASSSSSIRLPPAFYEPWLSPPASPMPGDWLNVVSSTTISTTVSSSAACFTGYPKLSIPFHCTAYPFRSVVGGMVTAQHCPQCHLRCCQSVALGDPWNLAEDTIHTIINMSRAKKGGGSQTGRGEGWGANGGIAPPQGDCQGCRGVSVS